MNALGPPPDLHHRAASDREDYDFATEVAAAIHQGPSRAMHLLLLAIVALFGTAIAWASWATVDEITRGDGRVVPSRQMQVIQSLEPGIVEEILVQNGDIVEVDQILVRIDDTSFSAELGELLAQQRAIRARIARLESELNGDEVVVFSDELVAEAPRAVSDERALFVARQEELSTQLGILRQQAEQREQELQELAAAEEQYVAALSVAQQQLGVYQSVGAGVVPRVEMLDVQQRVIEYSGNLEQTRGQVRRAEAAIAEAFERIEDQYLQFRSDARTQLNDERAQLEVIAERLRNAENRVTRTDIRSPVSGIVNQVNVTTVGGVIQQGENIIEIVPIEDSLLIQARIRPSDVAFLRPGLPATVKISAYDFAVYGGLDGIVERISADTIVDEETGESFYEISVRTEETTLGSPDNPLPIIPGMVASVDILTGEKSILEYLLNPLRRTMDEALTER